MPSEVTADMDQNAILPFQIDGQEVRGRVVRLTSAVDEILSKHDYPAPISELLAHALTLAAMLGNTIKFDGKLTLQAKGNGPVGSIVADFRTPGALRGWVSYDEVTYQAAVEGGIDPGREVPQLMGAGHLAFTVDQGADMERYQGIVGLEGGTLAECAQKYFDDSEQLPTAVKLSARQVDGQWRASGIMLQYLPPAGRPLEDRDDEAWREAAILMSSVRDEELIDSDLPPDRLLFRLFHEPGVRVFDPEPVEVFCQCSRDRIGRVLKQFATEDLADMVVDGKIVVTCEFCTSEYVFDPPA
ncbi:MAG: Hsp33 family molecular chaperone [Alphaproteobacteria bacterium]